eukprot:m.10738 g.10738  ORF g.10738 m.10738 type:complete len:576 (-) comp4313_c0_seq1:47-1774(-)
MPGSNEKDNVKSNDTLDSTLVVSEDVLNQLCARCKEIIINANNAIKTASVGNTNENLTPIATEPPLKKSIERNSVKNNKDEVIDQDRDEVNISSVNLQDKKAQPELKGNTQAEETHKKNKKKKKQKKKGSGTKTQDPTTSLHSDRYNHVRKLLEDEPDVKNTVEGLARDLTEKKFCLYPDFLGRAESVKLAVEVKQAWRKGKLKSGKLAGGRSGKNTRYTLEDIRGDKVGWFSGDPCHDDSTGRLESNLLGDDIEGACWDGTTLKMLMRKIGTIVQLVASQIPELQGIETRSEAMVTCYPGNGSRYIKHADNPNRNGRKLTVIYYLNHGWKPGDGGELRIYDEDDLDKTILDVPPVADTLLLFYSDRRVPHEVLPTNVERFAVTHWFYDHEERTEAEREAMGSGMSLDLQIERSRIEHEISKFEEKQNKKAQVETLLESDSQTSDLAKGEHTEERGDRDDVTDMISTTSFSPEKMQQDTAIVDPQSPRETPVYSLTDKTDGDCGNASLLAVELPGVSSAKDIEFEVDTSSVFLKTEGPKGYELTLKLPFKVDPDRVEARYRKKREMFYVTLPKTH